MVIAGPLTVYRSAAGSAVEIGGPKRVAIRLTPAEGACAHCQTFFEIDDDDAGGWLTWSCPAHYGRVRVLREKGA